MDPRPLTLRQVVWMAAGRQAAEWERTSWLMGWVGRLGGGPFEPDKLNPFGGTVGRPVKRPKLSPEQEAEAGWAVLGSGLRHLSKKR